MKKKQYLKPSIEVVVLKQAGMLMTSESVNVTMDGTWTEQDASREIDFDDLSTLMGR